MLVKTGAIADTTSSRRVIVTPLKLSILPSIVLSSLSAVGLILINEDEDNWDSGTLTTMFQANWRRSLLLDNSISKVPVAPLVIVIS